MLRSDSQRDAYRRASASPGYGSVPDDQEWSGASGGVCRPRCDRSQPRPWQHPGRTPRASDREGRESPLSPYQGSDFRFAPGLTENQGSRARPTIAIIEEFACAFFMTSRSTSDISSVVKIPLRRRLNEEVSDLVYLFIAEAQLARAHDSPRLLCVAGPDD